jgi:hypothetical protein
MNDQVTSHAVTDPLHEVDGFGDDPLRTQAPLHAAQDRYPEIPGSLESHCFRKDP